MVKFYKCNHCGQIVIKVLDNNVSLMCCGEKMMELVPNTTDAANEKHVPVVTVSGHEVLVQVGSVNHPMLAEHHIAWIYLETTKGLYQKNLKPGDDPKAIFYLEDDEDVIKAYAYCNLHSLWASK